MSSKSKYFLVSKAHSIGEFHLGVEITPCNWFLVIIERTVDPRYQVSARFTPEEVLRSPLRLRVFQGRGVDWLVSLIEKQAEGKAVDREKVIDELERRKLYAPLDTILQLNQD